MTVAELGARMTFTEFVEWLAFFRIQADPDGSSDLLRKVELMNKAFGGLDKRSEKNG